MPDRRGWSREPRRASPNSHGREAHEATLGPLASGLYRTGLRRLRLHLLREAGPPSGREDVYSLAGPPRLRAHEHLPVQQRPSPDRALSAHRGPRGPSRNGTAGHAASGAAFDQGHPEGLCARRVQYRREPREGRGGWDRAPCPPARRAPMGRGHELHAAPRGDPRPAATPESLLRAPQGGVQFERRSAETSPRLTRPPRARQSGPFPRGQPQAPATYTLLTAEMIADDPPGPRGRPHRAVDH